jgi:hypothetical protein
MRPQGLHQDEVRPNRCPSLSLLCLRLMSAIPSAYIYIIVFVLQHLERKRDIFILNKSTQGEHAEQSHVAARDAVGCCSRGKTWVTTS